MKIFDKEFPDLPGLNPDMDVSKEEEKSVSIKVTREQIEKLRDAFGIDVTAMVENVIFNEIYNYCRRNLCS